MNLNNNLYNLHNILLKKLVFQFTKKKFTAKEEKEILWIAYKLALKHKSDFENKTPKLILPGRIETNSIYIEYY